MSEALKSLEYKYSPEVAQVDDINTWIAEVLDGSMRSEFIYNFNGEDLVARDGRLLGPVFEDAITSAEEKAWWQPELGFELRRRKIEKQEYEDMLAMARGEAPNTMVVVSDFPAELMGASEDWGGYNTSRRQTMLRVISKKDNGTISMISQSLDCSDRGSLEAIYDFMGVPVMRGELLGQRIYAQTDSYSQKFLPDSLMKVYDNELEIKYGAEFYAGRRSNDRRNTMMFAKQQEDLLNAYLSGLQDRDSMFKLAAAITARFEGQRAEYSRNTYMPPALEMEIQGRLAALKGKTFSGCGGSISMGISAENELAQLGYGDEDKKSDDDTMKCVNCPECKTFHHEVRTVRGKPVCDNAGCKLSDRKK